MYKVQVGCNRWAGGGGGGSSGRSFLGSEEGKGQPQPVWPGAWTSQSICRVALLGSSRSQAPFEMVGCSRRLLCSGRLDLRRRCPLRERVEEKRQVEVRGESSQAHGHVLQAQKITQATRTRRPSASATFTRTAVTGSFSSTARAGTRGGGGGGEIERSVGSSLSRSTRRFLGIFPTPLSVGIP